MHYCDNRNCKPRAESPGTSKNAEVAVFESKASGAWRTKEVWLKLFGVNLSDDVTGHVTPEEVAAVMAFVSKMVS
jgi:hypothetical protein